MGLSKNQLKLITSLRQKKYRQKHKLFVAEGVKVVNELLNSSLEVEQLFVLEGSELEDYHHKSTYISATELKKISSLKTPNNVLGLFRIPSEKPIQSKGLIVALDEINDPGNLGTIIRLCDWFGVKQLVCSKNTADHYNQKVVQSTMGSLTRVQVNTIELSEYLKNIATPIFTADMDGNNVYSTNLPSEGVLVMGNEANGISPEINSIVQNKLTIPRFGDLRQTESLNVATATAIILSEFRRAN